MNHCKRKKCTRKFTPRTPKQLFCNDECRVLFFNERRARRDKRKAKDTKQGYNSMSCESRPLYEMMGCEFPHRSQKFVGA